MSGYSDSTSAAPTGVTITPKPAGDAQNIHFTLPGGHSFIKSFSVTLAPSTAATSAGSKMRLELEVGSQYDGLAVCVQHDISGAGSIERFYPVVKGGSAAVYISSLSPFYVSYNPAPPVNRDNPSTGAPSS